MRDHSAHLLVVWDNITKFSFETIFIHFGFTSLCSVCELKLKVFATYWKSSISQTLWEPTAVSEVILTQEPPLMEEWKDTLLFCVGLSLIYVGWWSEHKATTDKVKESYTIFTF